MQKLRIIPYPAIRVRHLGKRYNTVTALHDVSFDVAPGATAALVGPSGCGKTTLLRLIAGLERPDRGEIWLGDRLVATPQCSIPPASRRLNMIFQDLALWPHMTVRRHIAFCLPPGKYRGQAKNRQIALLTRLVRLDSPESYPHQLSGGEQQRLAIARALASEPRILLFDEPLSSLDRALKLELLAEIKKLTSKLAMTCLYVTHQPDEVVYLADTVFRMAGGSLQASCTVEEFARQESKKWEETDSILRTQEAGRIIPMAANAR